MLYDKGQTLYQFASGLNIPFLNYLNDYYALNGLGSVLNIPQQSQDRGLTDQREPIQRGDIDRIIAEIVRALAPRQQGIAPNRQGGTLQSPFVTPQYQPPVTIPQVPQQGNLGDFLPQQQTIPPRDMMRRLEVGGIFPSTLRDYFEPRYTDYSRQLYPTR